MVQKRRKEDDSVSCRQASSEPGRWKAVVSVDEGTVNDFVAMWSVEMSATVSANVIIFPFDAQGNGQ
jgi:hypothetical protein